MNRLIRYGAIAIAAAEIAMAASAPEEYAALHAGLARLASLPSCLEV